MIDISPKCVFSEWTTFKFHDLIFLKSFLGSVIQKSLFPVYPMGSYRKDQEKRKGSPSQDAIIFSIKEPFFSKGLQRAHSLSGEEL